MCVVEPENVTVEVPAVNVPTLVKFPLTVIVFDPAESVVPVGIVTLAAFKLPVRVIVPLEKVDQLFQTIEPELWFLLPTQFTVDDVVVTVPAV